MRHTFYLTPPRLNVLVLRSTYKIGYNVGSQSHIVYKYDQHYRGIFILKPPRLKALSLRSNYTCGISNHPVPDEEDKRTSTNHHLSLNEPVGQSSQRDSLSSSDQHHVRSFTFYVCGLILDEEDRIDHRPRVFHTRVRKRGKSKLIVTAIIETGHFSIFFKYILLTSYLFIFWVKLIIHFFFILIESKCFF